ncbi:hypothetical protein ACH4SK_04755 [Streptomyces inhibens]|uniref:hypothetical protein n=1 Tax=Streptomyces inhibens TaxID=2293571 RepID=UPI0037B8D0E2
MCGEPTRSPLDGRGELEITDLNRHFVDLGRGSAWSDTGTHESLMDAALFVQVLAERQGIRLARIEEVSYRMGFINAEQLTLLGKEFVATSALGYGRSLMDLAIT